MRGVRRQARGGFGGCSTLGDGGLHGPPYRSVFASAAKTTPSYSLGCFGAPQERANALDAKRMVRDGQVERGGEFARTVLY